MQKKKPTIGFIGQGFVGKSYADDFEKRGFPVVRYSMEKPFVQNKEKISGCDIVFVAVPTPTTPKGFDASTVRKVIPLAKKGAIVVIKSTLLPGTTDKLQEEFADKIILFSPEFLIAKTAAKDASRPILNIVGFPEKHPSYKKHAAKILGYLPKSPHQQVTTAREAELFKYAHNVHGYFRVIFANLIFDLSKKLGARYEEIKKAMDADPFMTKNAFYYNNPVHQSGRGAGGACYIKDFAAFRELYGKTVAGDTSGLAVLKAFEDKNIELLRSSKKDLDLLKGVYGEKVMQSRKR